MRFAGGSLVVETVVIVVAIVAGVSVILPDQSCCERCCSGVGRFLSVDGEEVVDEEVFREGGGAL
jgi:hypothetical protein